MIALLIQPLALSSVREAQFRSVEPFHAVGRRTFFAPSERLRRWAAALECLHDSELFAASDEHDAMVARAQELATAQREAFSIPGVAAVPETGLSVRG